MSSLNLTTAFLITQLVLFTIIYAGILVLRSGETTLSSLSSNPRPATKQFPSYLVGFTLITLALLFFSQDFLLLPKPVFGDVELPGLPKTSVFVIVFVLDIVVAGLLMYATGGAKDSPFSAVLFILPAISIFLREPPIRYFSYTGLVVFMFLVFRKPGELGNSIGENPRRHMAHIVVTLSCIGLSTLVGYVTRPI